MIVMENVDEKLRNPRKAIQGKFLSWPLLLSYLMASAAN